LAFIQGFRTKGLDEPSLNPYVTHRNMRLFIYLVALLTGLCTVNAGSAAQPAPAAISAAYAVSAKPIAHHQAILAEKSDHVPAPFVQEHLPRPDIGHSATVKIFSMLSPVERSDLAHL
jgi:hypothetical protein